MDVLEEGLHCCSNKLAENDKRFICKWTKTSLIRENATTIQDQVQTKLSRLFTRYLTNFATTITALPLSSANKIVASSIKRNLVLECQEWTSVLMPFWVDQIPSYKRAHFKETWKETYPLSSHTKKEKEKKRIFRAAAEGILWEEWKKLED